MMTVHKIGGADVTGYANYLTSQTPDRRGDYYLGAEGRQAEGVGTWHGKAAAELGLTGEVSRDDLMRVWEGKDPSTGEIVIRRSAKQEHVAAVDCTFSAPKSVSVTWALASPAHRAELEAAHSAAVVVALAHIEEHSPLVRRRVDGAIRHEQADGLAIARFRHHTSRVCAEQHEHGLAADPQLHDHCAIANLALRKEDALDKRGGRWAAIDSRELFRVAAEAGAVYRAELAADLQQMGYRVHREGRYFEITGVSTEARRTFSQRAQEVEAATARFVAKHGRKPTAEEGRNLVVLSRHPKSNEPVSAFEQWQSRADEAGLSRADAEGLRGRPVTPLALAVATTRVLEELVTPDRQHSLTKSSAVFDERTLRIAVAEAAQGRARGSDVGSLITAVQQSQEIVKLDDVHHTTQKMLDTERAVLTEAHRKSVVTQGFAAHGGHVADAVKNARVPLSEEQQAAVRALTDGRALALITAPAGAGKGEVLRAVTAAYQADGRRVIALAAAGETAQRLGAETGANETRTIDSFIHRANGDNPPDVKGVVIVVDEAGLLETARWHKLLPATAGAKVIAAGDAAQLSPIEAGGLWSVLEKQLGAATLSENFRAHDQWARDAWDAVRTGNPAEALRAFEERGQLVIAEDRLAAQRAAVDRWDQDRRAGVPLDRLLIVTDSSNAEVDALNAAAQQRRLAAGELGTEALTVSTKYSNREAVREEQLHPGDVVTFERRLYPTREQQQRDGRGDIPRERRVENGEAGTITGVDVKQQTATVRLRDRSVTVGQDQLDALRLGYAQHVYSAQGRTVDTTYALVGGWQTDRENSYVGISRARKNTVVITDYSSLNVEPGQRDVALTELSERFAQSRSKVAAVALSERGGVAEGGQQMDAYAEEVDRRVAQAQRAAQRHGDTLAATELDALRATTREQIAQEHETPKGGQSRALDDQERERQLEQERQRQLDRDDPGWTRE